MTIWEMAEDTRMFVGSRLSIFTENLDMCCASAAEHLHRPSETNWTDWEMKLIIMDDEMMLWEWCQNKASSFTEEIRSHL